MPPRTPNLFVIGAMKAGTTSLHEYLNQHPDIFMSEKKEIDFFLKEKNWSKGKEWYLNQFMSDSTYAGESSQNYSKRHYFAPNIAERIRNFSNSAKIIYIVRDPIDRIISHYHEHLEGSKPPQGINIELSKDLKNHNYVLTSSYAFQLDPFIEKFGLENIHVLSLDELKSDKLGSMNHIFEFLGLPILNDPSQFDFVLNEKSSKRRRTHLGQFAFGSQSRMVRKLLPRKVKDWARYGKSAQSLISKPITPETLDPNIADAIRTVLKDDIDRFRELTGKPFHNWSV